MRKYYFVTMLVILFPVITFTQMLNVHKNDGSVYNFTISEIDSITFSGRSNIPSNGLVAYYPFNGNANDKSGNGNHGVVEGATLVSDRFGTINNAYEFDGVNDKIEFGDVGILDGANSVTISLWIKYSTHSGSYDPFINKGPIAHPEASFAMQYSSSNIIGVQFGSGGTTISTNHTSNTADDGIWHNVLFLLKNKEAKIYVNGVLQNSVGNIDSRCTAIQDNSYPMVIGYNPTDNHLFKGQIDDIRIYDRSLTEDEISVLFHENGWE